jgi:hypothetical protein
MGFKGSEVQILSPRPSSIKEGACIFYAGPFFLVSMFYMVKKKDAVVTAFCDFVSLECQLEVEVDWRALCTASAILARV